MRGTLIWSLVLLWTVHLSMAADITCFPELSSEAELLFSITFSESDFPTGFESSNYAKTSCEDKKDISTSVSFGMGCFYELDKPIELITFFYDDPFQTQVLKWEVTCGLNTQSIEFNSASQVNIPDASIAVGGDLVVDIDVILQPSYIVGETITFEVSLAGGYAGYAEIAILELDVNGIIFMAAGCTDNVPDSYTIIGQGSSIVLASWDAFFTDGFGFEGQSFDVTGLLEVCEIGNCDYSMCDPLSRKRREVTGKVNSTIDIEAKTMVFIDKASKEQYDQQIARAQSAESDQMCVNKTVSMVIIVVLISGMIVCLLTTIWMFFKMRKVQRGHASRKTDLTYSNKSFKM